MESWFPDQGANAHPPAVEAQSLHHWTVREVPRATNVRPTGLAATIIPCNIYYR